MIRTVSPALALCLAIGCNSGEAPEVAQPADTEPNTDVGDDPDNDPIAEGPSFQVLLTDAPGDFDEVWVDIMSVEIHSQDQGWLTLTDAPQSFDLLTLQNDVTAALGGADLEPGHYGQLRLLVDNAFVVAGGVSEDLTIASGAQTGIKLNLDADVEAGMVYSLVIDFDADKSVKQTGQGWHMTPTITVKDFIAVPQTPADPADPADPGAGDPGAGDPGAGDPGAGDPGAGDAGDTPTP